MKIKVAHHIFASRKGYQTQFRSPDVTDSENAELESFSFGQTNDANYMASLKKHPAFTVRKLRSGRWAITRAFQGADDDYGRATLRFHTVLVSQEEWASRLDFDILPFLEHPAIWKDTESTEISVEPDHSPLPHDIAEQVLFLLNQLTDSRSPVIVDESICSLQTIRWVHRRLLDEEKEEFSYGYRVLSDAMDASLLCLARQALRTTSPGTGRYDRVRVSAPSPFKTPDYENMDMAYEKQAGSNKMAILIIITVCVLGIAGAIFALVSFGNAQKKNAISGIIKRANELLENNYSFFADPNELAHAVKESEKIRDEIDKLEFPAPELVPIREKLVIWISEEAQVRKLFGDINKLEDDLANKQLKPVSPPYPLPNKINSVITIENKFESILTELLIGDEFSSLMFFGDAIDDLEGKVDTSRENIASWKKDIGKLIAIDPNIAEEIEAIVNKTGPNRYISADPNQLNFGDPNLPYYIDPKTPDWRNPEYFLKLAQWDIQDLNHAKLAISKQIHNNASLLNAKRSQIPSHKKLAETVEAKLIIYQKTANKYFNYMQKLKQKATDIERIEDTLNSKQNVVPIFLSALKQHDNKLDTDLTNPEKVWVHHLKSVILVFYRGNIKPKLRTYFESTVKNLYKQIQASSLNSEPVFKSLYDYHGELEQENNKSRQQKNRPEYGRTRK